MSMADFSFTSKFQPVPNVPHVLLLGQQPVSRNHEALGSRACGYDSPILHLFAQTKDRTTAECSDLHKMRRSLRMVFLENWRTFLVLSQAKCSPDQGIRC